MPEPIRSLHYRADSYKAHSRLASWPPITCQVNNPQHRVRLSTPTLHTKLSSLLSTVTAPHRGRLSYTNSLAHPRTGTMASIHNNRSTHPTKHMAVNHMVYEPLRHINTASSVNPHLRPTTDTLRTSTLRLGWILMLSDNSNSHLIPDLCRMSLLRIIHAPSHRKRYNKMLPRNFNVQHHPPFKYVDLGHVEAKDGLTDFRFPKSQLSSTHSSG